MPTIQNEFTIAIGATVNAATGSVFEYIPNDAHVSIGLMADVVGLLFKVTSGDTTLAEEGTVPFNATAGVYPKDPDDFHWTEQVAGGDRLGFFIRNPTAGAIKVRMVAKLTYM